MHPLATLACCAHTVFTGSECCAPLMALERGKSQLFLPDWKVIHDMKWAGTPGVGRVLNHFLNGGESRRQKIPKLILQVRAQILRATSPTPNSKCELQGARARRRGGRRALMVLEEDQRRLLESHLLWMDE